MTRPSNAKRVVVVEGETDRHFVSHFLDANGLKLNVEVTKRVGTLLKDIGPRLKGEPERIGFVFDANGNPDDRWGEVRSKIVDVVSELEKHIPKKPSSGEVWATNLGSFVGMWMMPDNKSAGELEDLIFKMIDDGDCWKHAREYVEKLPAKERRFPKNKTKKAMVHAWLAVQKKPGGPPGAVIKKAMDDGYINTNTPEAQSFRDWLQRLAR